MAVVKVPERLARRLEREGLPVARAATMGQKRRAGALSPVEVGDKVLLPSGTPVGMGKLKRDTPAVVEYVQYREDGTPIYLVVWIEKDRRRKTWIDRSVGFKRLGRGKG